MIEDKSARRKSKWTIYDSLHVILFLIVFCLWADSYLRPYKEYKTKSNNDIFSRTKQDPISYIGTTNKDTKQRNDKNIKQTDDKNTKQPDDKQQEQLAGEDFRRISTTQSFQTTIIAEPISKANSGEFEEDGSYKQSSEYELMNRLNDDSSIKAIQFVLKRNDTPILLFQPEFTGQYNIKMLYRLYINEYMLYRSLIIVSVQNEYGPVAIHWFNGNMMYLEWKKLPLNRNYSINMSYFSIYDVPAELTVRAKFKIQAMITP